MVTECSDSPRGSEGVSDSADGVGELGGADDSLCGAKTVARRPAAAKPIVHKERAKTRRVGGKASWWPAGLESAVRKEVMHWRDVSDCMDDHQEFGSAHHWRCP
eukprot:1091884-Pyramimonas_sp.AAC.1